MAGAAVPQFQVKVTMGANGAQAALEPSPKSNHERETAIQYLLQLVASSSTTTSSLNAQLSQTQHELNVEAVLRESALKELISQLHDELALSRSHRERQNEQIAGQNERIVGLEELAACQREEIACQKVQIASLNVRLDERDRKDGKITVREIARILERHICVKVAGSISQAKRNYFNLSKLREDSTMKARLSTVLNSHNLASGTIERLKEEGNAVCHDARDPETKESFLALIAGANDDDEDKLQHIALVNTMVTFNMILPDGTISTSDKVW
jgi:chromosome segregation ATPase